MNPLMIFHLTWALDNRGERYFRREPGCMCYSLTQIAEEALGLGNFADASDVINYH